MAPLPTDSTPATRPDKTYGKIFLAEGSPVLCELAKYHLESDGYRVDTAMTLEELNRADLSGYVALILDYSIAGSDTYRYVESHAMNGDTCNVALLVMCTPSSETKAYDTLDAGADAVLRKPFSMKELSAHLKSILRRRQPAPPRARVIRHVSHDNLSVDLETYTVMINDQAIDIPQRAAEVLGFLMIHNNHFFKASELGTAIWPDKPELHTDICLTSIVTQIKHHIGRYALYLFSEPRYAYCYAE